MIGMNLGHFHRPSFFALERLRPAFIPTQGPFREPDNAARLIETRKRVVTMISLIYAFNFAVMVLLTIVLFYSHGLSVLGFFDPKPPAEAAPNKRFLLLVPAHDEEAVIGALIENLAALNYPKHLFDIYVIADNCGDKTASVARHLGAKVLEHTYLPGEKRGKPYAIEWALRQVNVASYDAVAFFDADNLVAPNYLQVMNNHLHGGARLIQAYLDTKNPNDNWMTISYAAAYYYMNRAWQVGRHRLGLSVGIGGTGFCVDTQLLQTVGWTATTLTEDLEFQMQCLLVGVRARFALDTRVYDEKPLEFRASVIQRLRWARGHWQVFFRYFVPLLSRSIRNRDYRCLDGLLYLLNPTLIVLSLWIGLSVLLQGPVASLVGHQVQLLPSFFPAWFGNAVLVYQIFYMSWCVRKDTNNRTSHTWMYVLNLSFNAVYLPLIVWGLFTMSDNTWKRTEHVRAVDVKQLTHTEVPS